MAEAVRTKDALPDLINVAIGEFVRQRIEFPVLGVFDRAAQHVRATVARAFYCAALAGDPHVAAAGVGEREVLSA